MFIESLLVFFFYLFLLFLVPLLCLSKLHKHIAMMIRILCIRSKWTSKLTSLIVAMCHFFNQISLNYIILSTSTISTTDWIRIEKRDCRCCCFSAEKLVYRCSCKYLNSYLNSPSVLIFMYLFRFFINVKPLKRALFYI